MSKHCLCFGYLPPGEAFEHEGNDFEVFDFERARLLSDKTLWFFDKYQPVYIDESRLEDLGSPTKAPPHHLCRTPCIACQGGDMRAVAAQELLQHVKMTLDESATLDDITGPHVEVLALYEILMRLGFPFEKLAFMPSEEVFSVAIHLDDPAVIERLDGDTVYVVKATDLPPGTDWKPLFLTWGTSALAWRKATPEQRQALVDRSKIKELAIAIRDELDKMDLLPTRQN